MRILVTGANGFIGSHIVSRLLNDGHDVVAAVRDPAAIVRRWPGIEAIACDMNRDTLPGIWLARIEGIDAVVNCAGALQNGRGQNLEAIHHTAPAALFDACLTARVQRVIQVSAIGAAHDAPTQFARTKAAGDAHLMGLALDWTVLRPSLVYGERSYGGTSLLRAIAAFPFAVPVVGDGSHSFTPIHVKDLAATVAVALGGDSLKKTVVEPVGPEILSTRDVLRRLRAWLGLPDAPFISIPLRLVFGMARLGDMFGVGPLRTTTVRQMLAGTAGDPDRFRRQTGIEPRSFAQALRDHPAGVQDAWHARLFFLGPVLKIVLALFWIWTGIVTLTMPPGAIESLAERTGQSIALIEGAAALGGVLDLGLGLALLAFTRLVWIAIAMLAASAGYLVSLTVLAPALWLDPFAPLAKIPVVIVATLVLMVIGRER